MKLRRLNDNGVAQLEEFLDSLTTDSPQAYPTVLLQDAAATEVVEPQVEIENQTFSSRFEAAEYLHGKLSGTGLSDVERDKGLWSWLALFYFDQLCPADKNGQYKPGERARWIPAVSNYQRYYRHLLSGPYRVYRAHRDNPQRALALLCGPLHENSDTYKELAEKQELVTNPTVVEVATLLYYDSKKQRLKVAGKRGAPGTVRRFTQVLTQLETTRDLFVLDSTNLLKLLPAEFNRFQPTQPS